MVSSGDVYYMLNATIVTIQVSAFTIVLAAILGLGLGVLSELGDSVVRGAVAVYVYVIRGIPIIVLLFLMFFGLPSLGFRFSGPTVAVISISVYMSALVAEIIRGSIRALPIGQWDAARALGLSEWQALSGIVLPQALRAALPPCVSLLPATVKTTAFASIVSVTELTLAAREISNSSFHPIPIFGIAFVIYFVLCYPLTVASKALERRLSRYAL
jgi:His/Glu/Gln/Arg/opine family amino acid ABC transporter permease subunit